MPLYASLGDRARLCLKHTDEQTKTTGSIIQRKEWMYNRIGVEAAVSATGILGTTNLTFCLDPDIV